MQILEQISPDTIVFLQTHKRIWPAIQRDALFWSHMQNIKDNVDKDAHDVWAVCNHSIEHAEYPVIFYFVSFFFVLKLYQFVCALFFRLQILENVFDYS